MNLNRKEWPRRDCALASDLARLLRERPARDLLGFCLFEAAFYFAYQYSIGFSQESAAPFWFPDALLFCALLVSPSRMWWLFLLGPLPIRLGFAVSADVPHWFLLVTFAIDSAKAVLAAGAMRYFLRDFRRFNTVRDFALFCLVVVLMVPALAAFVGAATGHPFTTGYWQNWSRWFMGNALTNLVVTPAILYWMFDGWRTMRTFSVFRWIEMTLVATGLVATDLIAFNNGPDSSTFTESRFYAMIPFLVWAAVRFGMFGASGAIATVAFLCVGDAFDGHGPFSGESPNETATALQHFLLLRAVPLYVVAILIEERTRIGNILRESEKRFRIVANTAPVMIWTADADKLCDFFNQGWLTFTGRSLQQELGNGWAESVHADDLEQCLRLYNHAFDARQSFEIEYRLRRRDGEYRWILDRGVPRFSPDGKFAGYIGSATDISDRRAQEKALRESEQRYRVVSTQLMHAQQEERDRIARDLHDDFNQRLAALAIGLGNLQHRVEDDEHVGVAVVRRLHDEAIGLGDEIRLIAHQLHSPTFEQVGFAVTLRSFCDEFSALTQLPVHLSIHGDTRVPADIALCCYRVVQEALQNIQKHARATSVEVHVGLGSRIILVIADNGAGREANHPNVSSGLGLKSMAERVQSLRGKFRITDRRGGGTVVSVEIPLEK